MPAERTRFPDSEPAASAAALGEATDLRATNADLQNRVAYLEEQLIQRDKLLESLPQAFEQTTPKTSGGAVQTCVCFAPYFTLLLDILPIVPRNLALHP